MMAVMKGFQRSADGVRRPQQQLGVRRRRVSSREEKFVYLDYFMYGIFVELYGV